MSSVTQRIKEIKQPYGGYLKPSEFKKIQFEDNNELGEENIHSSIVGLAVDYLTRFIMGTSLEKAFKISLMGSIIINDSKHAYKLLHNIKGLDNKSIYNACKLVGYDVCFRVGPMAYKDVKTIQADGTTIDNIRIMVDRSIKFFEKYGPIIKDGFTFEGGYTKIIDSGDGDFLTKDTLWDFKVSSSAPKSQHTLQLLIYYIMGKNSIHSEFDTIKNLGIFNPRLNCVFLKKIAEIPNETIEAVSKEVIGYDSKNRKIISSDVLTITDVMKVLHCSRYMVMKFYSENNLPLKKINNKYYITKTELYEWIIEIEIKRKRQLKSSRLSILIAIPLSVIVYLILFIVLRKYL